MTRTDPYDEKTGVQHWDQDIPLDGQKAISALVAEFRKNPNPYISAVGFKEGPEDHRGQRLWEAMEAGRPFAVTLHDNVDYTSLHARWWLGGAEFFCKFKIITVVDNTDSEDAEPPYLEYKLVSTHVTGSKDLGGKPSQRVDLEKATAYLSGKLFPCPLADERVDLWWSLTGRTDQTMFHWALMPESDTWMQLS